jgi:hypothetical protein
MDMTMVALGVAVSVAVVLVLSLITAFVWRVVVPTNVAHIVARVGVMPGSDTKQ